MRGFNEKKCSVPQFYEGKTIFITGSSGFCGTVLLEEFLRICPGIKRIYILMRSRKGVDPQTRADEIFKKSLFDKLREENSESLKKVHVCVGDISEKNLGMSDADLETLYDEVNIVFHVAASINFLKPFKYIIIHNSMSTQYTVDICKKIKNLEAFVYTSTAYSNCNRRTVMEEEIYRMPFNAEKFVQVITEGTDEDLDKLVAQCHPLWPNSYTFSKCLSENILMDNAADLPVAIVRPSLVISTWRHPFAGYVEDTSGISLISVGSGKGFIQVLHADPEHQFDLIPADVVAHAHMLIAWRIATGRSPSHTVLNCTSFSTVPLKEYIQAMYDMVTDDPLPKTFRSPQLMKVQKNDVAYWLTAAYEHYLPAIFMDAGLRMMGKRPRLVKLYKFLDKTVASLNFFLTNHWEYKTDNFRRTMDDLEEEDKNLFGVYATDISMVKLARDLPIGSPFFQWEIDNKPMQERLRMAKNNYWITQVIKASAVALFSIFAYTVISQAFY